MSNHTNALPAPSDHNDDPLQAIGQAAVQQVEAWLERAKQIETKAERQTADQLAGVVTDPGGVAFAMRFVDRVMRPEGNRSAADQLVGLVEHQSLPAFLSPIDKLLLRAGSLLAPVLPGIVMPLAARRMRGLVGHLVVDSDPKVMAAHFQRRSEDGFRLNVNLLGEAVLGDAEADRRHQEALELLDQPDVDYVSVKVSAIVSQLNYWDWNGSVDRVTDRLRLLFAKAATTSPATFINLDMEEYHDLELTMEVFMRLLDEPEFHAIDAGIVLQAYLPDSFRALQQLSEWAADRRSRLVDGQPGGTIKVRLVKGANLAMERVEAALHDWEQAPYGSKAETDANYKRCLDWVLTSERLSGIRIGVASHNLFDVAFAHHLAESRGVSQQIEFEMLEGMADSHARVVRSDGGGLVLYTPVVAKQDFDVAISYLFRRLEENAAEENFVHHLFELRPGSPAFKSEANKFLRAVADRWDVQTDPRRSQDRSQPFKQNRIVPSGDAKGSVQRQFHGEPDTDPALSQNRRWAQQVIESTVDGVSHPLIDDPAAVDEAFRTARDGQQAWASVALSDRQAMLHDVADELSRRRGDLIAAMVHEGKKTFEQADPEVSEAIDFARYYGDRTLDLARSDSAHFVPFGVVAVIPPWNFPVAIPTGGVMGALAAGNSVLFKPAPETPRCAEIVAECCWAAGVPKDVLQYIRVPDNEIGQRLVTGADAVILTGGFETAELFRSWKPDMRLLAETSGKNALIITSNADIDLAVADLVASAFGHSGQKCSAASLAICVGEVYDSPRLRRQLHDAVTSLRVGPTTDVATNVGPTIAEPEGKLLKALTELGPGESWLVEPRRIGPQTWSPGVRLGVAPGSWFADTECFGPVLGIVAAEDLESAIRIQNASAYGLTGGIHSLDSDEIEQWLDQVEVGNAYVNRQITGAIVERQPFGGWKRSSIGPGAKAGGPNYLAQLGTWIPNETDLDTRTDKPDKADETWLALAQQNDEQVWRDEFSVEYDPTGLFCEQNTFRYRPLRGVAVRVETADDGGVYLKRVLAAAERCGVPVLLSHAGHETVERFATRLRVSNVERLRVLGPVKPEVRAAAMASELHIADDPVTADGYLELRHYLKEQAISRTLHRYGNLL